MQALPVLVYLHAIDALACILCGPLHSTSLTSFTYFDHFLMPTQNFKFNYQRRLKSSELNL